MNRLRAPRLSLKARKEQRTAYLCLIPAFIGLIVLTYWNGVALRDLAKEQGITPGKFAYV